jgi:transglutaminase-like putative cysteine protease
MANLILTHKLSDYLEASEFLDWQHPAILAKAAELAKGCQTDEAISQHCFAFVRDGIKHSWDYQLNPVTCKASDVLLHGTGYCYAKSHLLAALLRANAIPTGLCYQRLSLDGVGAPYCLHGLNAVYLQRHGWYRLDARGNKPGVTAEFTPLFERLAFAIVDGLECDFTEILPEPLPIVIEVLTRYTTIEDVYQHVPDSDDISSPNLLFDKSSL